MWIKFKFSYEINEFSHIMTQVVLWNLFLVTILVFLSIDYYYYEMNSVTHLGWPADIDLESKSVLFLKILNLIFINVNLDGLIYLLKNHMR